MTSAELERLPEILRDIVLLDRAAEPFQRKIRSSLVSIDDARIVRGQRSYRQDLTRAAASIWGHRLGGEDARC